MASSRRTGTNESRWNGSGWDASPSANTFGAAGYGRDYTSLSTWEDATDVDLVTATKSAVLECYADASSYATNLLMSGATTSSSYFRIIRPVVAARHLGSQGSGIKFTSTSDTNATNWEIDEENSGLQDLELNRTQNSASNYYVTGTTQKLGAHLVGLLVSGSNAGAGVISGITDCYRQINCILFEHDGNGVVNATYYQALAYNITSVGCSGTGFVNTGTFGSTLVAKNCIGYNNGTDYSGTFGSGTTHNLSKDATAPGTTNYRNKTLTFADADNDDYRLAATDTDAIGAGTDLSGDGTFAFDDDIAFTVRS